MSDDSIFASIQEKQFKEHIQEMKLGFDSLNQLNVRSIPEVLFVNNFLPLFCGEISNKLPMFNDLLNVWLNIAGTNYSPVNVVDNKGNVIIVVPPINDKDILKPIISRTEDIAYVFMEAKAKSVMSPSIGANIIAEGLGSRISSLITQEKPTTIQEQWTKLFTHYSKMGKVKPKSIVTDGVEDDFEW
jgi:hypothetical protein